MKVLCFGSVNLDHVYQVDHMVCPGETLSSSGHALHPGGKGLNQAVALRRAGLEVQFAGRVGQDGDILRQLLNDCGVDTCYLETVNEPTGHTIIQVDKTGQNCILLYGGANQTMEEQQIERIMKEFGPEDVIVCQNEINHMELITRIAVERGIRLALNPSPMNAIMTRDIIARATWLYINEVEAAELVGRPVTEPESVAADLLQLNPSAVWIMTLGKEGSCAITQQGVIRQESFRVQAVDTTAAGDTFTGYHLEAILRGASEKEALKRASMASALTVSRAGASSSIPSFNEVDQALLNIDI